MTIFELGLAAWRLSELVGTERGPWAILSKARALIGVTHDKGGNPVSFPDTEIGTLLSCVYCRSMWAGIVVVALAQSRRTRWIARALAAAGLALLLWKGQNTMTSIHDMGWAITHGSR